MLRARTHLLRLVVALWVALVAVTADARVRLVGVREFCPTQLSIGKASALMHYKAWKADAKQRGMSLQKYAREVLPGELSKRVVPAFIDPEGRVRNTDAHHRIFALLKLAEQTGVEVKLPVEVIADYRGKSPRAFAGDFVGKYGKGWFSIRAGHKDALARMESLPSSYARLRDEPLRSALDSAFDRLGLSGRMFNDYIEFRVGRSLVRHGLYERLREKDAIPKHARSIPADRVFHQDVLHELEHMLRKPAMRAVLIENARDPSQVAAIEQALER